MSAEMDPGTLAVVDQHMAEVDVEIDRLMYVYEQMAKERGDAQAVLNLGKFLAERGPRDIREVAAVATMAIRRLSRSGGGDVQ